MVKLICFAAIFQFSISIAVAQSNSDLLPPKKNLWIIACVNGGPVKKQSSFLRVANLLIKDYKISVRDTNTLFLFAPALPQLFNPANEETNLKLASVPLMTIGEVGEFAPKMVQQYEQATQPTLDITFGIIYPHVLLKQLFTTYAENSYPAYSFDTIHTLIFSSQDNIYIESNAETTQFLEKNKTTHTDFLGAWYNILSNTDEDCYLRKKINRKINGLYIKISQLTASATQDPISKSAFTRFLKTRTDVIQERDSLLVIMRPGSFIDGIRITDLSYAFDRGILKSLVSPVDSIYFGGNRHLPDSMRIHAGFWVNDPLLGKKIIHRNYTLPFPPTASLTDHVVVHKWGWITGLVLLPVLVFFTVWLRKREKKLVMYKSELYSLFQGLPADKDRLPNKIQVFVFRFLSTGESYTVLQPGQQRNTIQAFFFIDGKLMVTATKKIYKGAPFLISQESTGTTIGLSVLKTSVWKLAKSMKKSNTSSWMEAIQQVLASPVTLEEYTTKTGLLLTYGTRIMGRVYFSKSKPFPVMPAYYAHKTDVISCVTSAINQLIADHGIYPPGNCNIIVNMPEKKIGLLSVTILETAEIRLNYFTIIDHSQTPPAVTDELLKGFLADNPNCPICVTGISATRRMALYVPFLKAYHSGVDLYIKKVFEAVELTGNDRQGLTNITQHSNQPVLTFELPDTGSFVQPVFTWLVPDFPLQLVLSKQVRFTKMFQHTIIKKLPFTTEGVLETTFICRKKRNYALYLSPAKNNLYLYHINPVEKFYFQKNVLVSIRLNLREHQLLINGQSYDIHL